MKTKNMNQYKWRAYATLYLFILPAIVLTFLFNYLPMFSNVIAFMDYNMFKGWMGLGSEWVGFKNFYFLKEKWFYELAWRTFYYNFAILVFSFPAALILALLLNELRNQIFKKVVQTVSYIPHFVSWVTVAGLFYTFLSVDVTGVINNIKVSLFGGERIIFMQEEKYFLPILIISQTWKEVGWGSILFLAALTTIDPHLYEAAKVDGAGRWRQMLHITLPGLLPTTVVLMIFSLGAMFSGNFDQMINMQNQVIQEDTNIISTYIYYRGVKGAEYSVATAIGLFSGIVSFSIIYIANYWAKRVGGISIV